VELRQRKRRQISRVGRHHGYRRNLYGTTLQGDTYCSGCGIVYELSPSEGGNWSEIVLHNFNGNDGSEPWDSPILDPAGNLYGTTSDGGTYSEGTVFELSPSEGGGWTETVLHSFQFDGHDGHSPVVAPLTLDPTGNIFGTTMSGGTNREGIVLSYHPGRAAGARPCCTTSAMATAEQVYSGASC
jgi:uncharacterized repeat protein (TIGR03803 family)